MIDNHARAAQIPSFSRMWFEPVPKDSSPHKQRRSASIRFPKYLREEVEDMKRGGSRNLHYSLPAGWCLEDFLLLGSSNTEKQFH
jgi:hypothetical protein